MFLTQPTRRAQYMYCALYDTYIQDNHGWLKQLSLLGSQTLRLRTSGIGKEKKWSLVHVGIQVVDHMDDAMYARYNMLCICLHRPCSRRDCHTPSAALSCWWVPLADVKDKAHKITLLNKYILHVATLWSPPLKMSIHTSWAKPPPSFPCTSVTSSWSVPCLEI